MITTSINGQQVFVLGEYIHEFVDSALFKKWCQSLDPHLQVYRIIVQSVDFVERDGKKYMLFAKFKADMSDKERRELPGIVFLRGDSVGFLIVLLCDEEEYVVIVNQARPAIGMATYPELPAGMIDGDEHVHSAALREIEEEIGLKIDEKDLLNLSELFLEGRWNKLYPSPGACDEGISLFLVRQNISAEMLKTFAEKKTGLEKDGEHITLSIFKIGDVCAKVPCVTLHSACMMYQSLKQKGIINEHA